MFIGLFSMLLRFVNQKCTALKNNQDENFTANPHSLQIFQQSNFSNPSSFEKIRHLFSYLSCDLA